jgi:hypothetical protein
VCSTVKGILGLRKAISDVHEQNDRLAEEFQKKK